MGKSDNVERLGFVVNRPLAQALDSTIDGALSVRRLDPSAEPRRVLDAAHALAEVFRKGGCLFVAGTDDRRSDVAHLSVEFVHPVVSGARTVAARSIAIEEILAQGCAGDACIVFARSTVDSGYRETVDAARARGMRTVALVPGVGTPDGHADHVIGVGGGGRESFVTTYHVLWEIVQVLLARNPVAA
jgi:D-sedoheptulose 7-phosphate isomerase